MIEVKIRPDEITLFGHANYAVAGQDIVCAGANLPEKGKYHEN